MATPSPRTDNPIDPARRPCWILTGVLLLAAEVAPAKPTATQPDQWDYEQYYAVYMNDQRVGYAALRERKLDGGGTEGFNGIKLALTTAGQTAHVTLVKRCVESADGTPVRFSQYHKLGPAPIRREGLIRNGKLALTTTQGGRTLTKQQRWDQRVLFEPATRRVVAERLKADGDEAVVWIHNPEAPGEGFSPTTLRRVGRERVKVSGREVRALHVSLSNPTFPAVQHDWLDDAFRAVAGQVALGPSLVLRLEACSKAFAHRQFDAPEIFTTNLIQLSQPLDQVETISSVRLTLALIRPLKEPLALPESARQRAAESTRDRLVVDLSRPAYPKPPTDGDPPLTDDLKRYLEATEQFDVNDAAIRAAGREAVGERTGVIEKARAIRDWTDSRLKFKEMGVVFGTASEVLRSRTGDCTEHTALLVALARASGIPARAVEGLVYARQLGRRRNLLAFHMWAQLYLHGQWVDFDAAVPGDPAHVARLALAVSGPDGKFDMNAAAAVYKLFGNVRSAAIERIERD